MNFRSYRPTLDDSGRRIDRIVRRFLPNVPLSGIYRFLRKGLIRVDGKKISPSFLVPENCSIEIAETIIPGISDNSFEKPLTCSLEILLETPEILFINKPKGIPVHGPGGLTQMIPKSNAEKASLSFKTGPLHRLDKDTTGIIAVSRSLSGARWFSSGIASGQFGKYYLGLAQNTLNLPAEWHDIDEMGKKMITHVVPLASSKDKYGQFYTLVQYCIVTGRKHQIRKQTNLHGFPLWGDTRYGGRKTQNGYLLHAWQLHFPENRLTDLPKRIAAPLPESAKTALLSLFTQNVLAMLDTGNVY